MRTKISLKWLALGLTLFLILGSLVWAVGNTWLAWQAVQRSDIMAASKAAGRAKGVVYIWNRTTLGQIPDLDVWYFGLKQLHEVPPQLPQLAKTLDHTTVDPDQQATATTVGGTVAPWLTWVQYSIQKLPQTWVVKRFISDQQLDQIDSLKPLIMHLQTSVLAEDQTWVILFQNSNELRATGGFTGSLAFVSLHRGSITKIEIQDIYQPDGQFTGFLSPPPGVAEYLSQGNGWRLPDLNWSPDYPTSAQAIRDYLSQTGHPNIAGVVAVNLDVVKAMLTSTGEVYLPDYQTTVTASNVDEVLRQDRDQFFPGSIAKQHILSNFMTVFKLKLANLDQPQQLAVLKVLANAASHKEIQAFSNDAVLQAGFDHFQVSGRLPQSAAADFYFFPVESNVGINKANQAVEREMQLRIGAQESQVKILLDNQNQPPPQPKATSSAEANHLQYVNYQRLLVLPTTQVTQVRFNQQPVTRIDESLITTSSGEVLKQFGFLVVVPEQTTGVLEVTLTHPPLNSGSSLQTGQQSGAKFKSLQLSAFGKNLSTPLTRDLLTIPAQWP